MESMKVHELQDLEAVSNFAANMFVDFSEHYIAAKGRFVVAVSGGSTPARLYALLGSDHYAEKIDWRFVHFFWADERFVPHNHEDSNFRLLHENLLSNIPIPHENIHPVSTNESAHRISAKKYEDEIKSFFPLSQGDLPEFDLILLGIGEDGHIASIFPGSAVLKEIEHLVVSVESKTHMHPRITLTLPVINDALNVIFLVSGKNKASVVKKVLKERDTSLPAVMVNPTKGELFFLIDRDAGMYLGKGPK